SNSNNFIREITSSANRMNMRFAELFSWGAAKTGIQRHQLLTAIPSSNFKHQTIFPFLQPVS
ncbi:MAG: hypothetical protein SOU02_10495, partial [Caecibacter massiliensis]|nr:hypothetical protein [Caecibacter massiliensis]